ncbi:MAG TPA: YsnF/AvaK domain-containing protein [Acidisarcina sp.]
MENVLTANHDLDISRGDTEIRLPGGKWFRLPTRLLLQYAGQQPPLSEVPAAPGPSGQPVDSATTSLIEEQLSVDKRTVETGRVRVEKHVEEYEQTLDVPLSVSTVEIKRVPCNQIVDTEPAIRTENDAIIYPVVEERLVWTRQLYLVEEVHILRRKDERRDNRTVSLKREHLTVTRTPADPAPTAG